jgi:cell wall-associated NlpC family hydrolase
MGYLRKVLISTLVVLSFLGLCVGVGNAAGSIKTGIIKNDVVNVRKSASTSSDVIAQVKKNVQVKVIDSSKDWYKVSISGETGWIKKSLVAIKSTSLGTATVTVSVLNVRSKTSISSKKVAELSKYDKVTLLSKSGTWSKVKTPKGKIGYVSSKYITTKKISRGVGVSDLSAAEEVIAYAKRYLGCNYVYGGSSPSGFDCSGFAQYVFKHVGISLDRTAASQSKQGRWVSKNDLIAGDLVFFDTNGGHNDINHVGIYVGNGKFIHASSPRYGVLITALSESYYERSYMTARRVD